MMEFREGHNAKTRENERQIWGKAMCGTTEIVKIWPNEPPPFDENQGEPSVYKVLLLWELIADKLLHNKATTSEVQIVGCVTHRKRCTTH